jgi:two-component system phosphate regulon sensor histidine kinase PhoR
MARSTHPRQVDVAVESGAVLIGDEAMITSAFSNLVDNAAKYTPLEGSMTIRWWTDESGAHFSVRDTGPGISAEHIPRLTERFYRVDPARSREMGGTGLGLAIVKHIVGRHRGRLEIASELGQGSTFTVHLRSRFPPPQAGEGESAITKLQ